MVISPNGMSRTLSKYPTSFQDSGFEGCLREWNLHPQVEVVRPFSKFHDSVLGYVGVFNGEYEVPENHPQHHRLNESPAHSAEH